MPPVTALAGEVHGQQNTGLVKMITIREHRFPFLVKVGEWNRFNGYTGSTLVEKCCRFLN